MELSDITTFYLSTQSTIDQLWEFFVISHLAIIGWLVSVNEEHIHRARAILTLFYSCLLAGLLLFFFEAYTELEMMHNDLLFILNQKNTADVIEDGYLNHLFNDVDINERKIRATYIFAASWLAMMSVICLSVKKRDKSLLS